MTQITASTGNQRAELWASRARELGKWLAVALVAFAIGAFVFAPFRQRAQPTYLPSSYISLPTGVITLRDDEGNAALLPVRIADTSASRMTGFREVGEAALANQFLLYAQTRQTSGRTSYSLEKVQVPLEFAAIDGEGKIVAVVSSSAGQERLTVTEPHRWVLAAKKGTFAHYGIEPGLTLDTSAIRKINL